MGTITQNPTISFVPQPGGAPAIYYLADGAAIFGCIGNPEGSIAAAPRSLAINESGVVYAKTTGSGNTGWSAIGGGGGGISGSGIAGQVTYWDGVSSVTGDSAFLYDDATGELTVADAFIAGQFGGIATRDNTLYNLYDGVFYEVIEDVFALGLATDRTSKVTYTDFITWGDRGVTTIAPPSAIADGDMPISGLQFYLDEAANLIKAKARESGGAIINATLGSGGGTTINSTDQYVPYRLNATTFADTPIRRTGSQTIFITDGITNFVSLGTGGMQVYQNGSVTFPVINVNSVGGFYVDGGGLFSVSIGGTRRAFWAASGKLVIGDADGGFGTKLEVNDANNVIGIGTRTINGSSYACISGYNGGFGGGTNIGWDSSTSITIGDSGSIWAQFKSNTFKSNFPVTFPATTGNKVLLYEGTDNAISIQANLIQFAAHNTSTRIGLGYGATGAFTEVLTVRGAKVGINYNDPFSELSLGATIGDKIFLYDGGGGNAYGMAVAANTYQQFTPSSSDAMLFGYGGKTASFTERLGLRDTGLRSIVPYQHRIAGTTDVTLSGRLYTQTDDVTIANTTTETTLLSGASVGTKTIPASTAVAGKVYRFKANGYWNAATTPNNSNFNIRFKLGSITIGTGSLPVPSDMGVSAPAEWDVEVDCIIRATGGSGAVQISGRFNNSQGSTTFDSFRWSLSSGSAAAIDTTASQAVDFTAQMSIANADNYIVCQSASIEIIG